MFFQIFYLFICSVDCSTRSIYFSNGEIKSYTEASKVCQSWNGSLLSYGREVIKAARQCNMQGFAWVGQPWVKPRDSYFVGCFKRMQDYGHGDIQNVTSTNSSSFECSSFCQDRKFNFIGVSIDKCWCFENFDVTVANSPNECRSNCHGYQAEPCGVREYINLYEKVLNLTENSNHNPENRQTFQYLSSTRTRIHASVQWEKHNFFCNIPTDEIIQPAQIKCHLVDNMGEMLTTKNVQVLSSTKPRSTSEYATASSNVEGYTSQTPTQMTTSKESIFNQSNLIILLAIVGSVVLVLIIVASTTYYIKTRKRNLPEDKAVTKSETHSQPSVCVYSLPEKKTKNDETDNVYDHACHSLLQTHDPNTGNIYDHSNSPEGMYDTTVIKNKCYEEDNPYDRVETVVNAIEQV